MRNEKKNKLAQLRRWRVRKKVLGTRQRPRMSVCFTQKNIYVQFVDDDARVTLASASTRHKNVENKDSLKANVTGAQKVGTLAAAAARQAGIEKVVFDRGAAHYHGKVKALADAARAGGLQF